VDETPIISIGFGETGLTAWTEEPEDATSALLASAGWTSTGGRSFESPGVQDLADVRTRLHLLRTAAGAAGIPVEAPPAELIVFTAGLTLALPGWGPPDVSLPSGGLPYLVPDIWDETGPLRRAFNDYAVDCATVVPGPGGADLAVVARPDGQGFMIGAVTPGHVSSDALPDLNPAIQLVGHDPAAAATVLSTDLLPRYERALREARLKELERAVGGMDWLIQESDAIAMDLRDSTSPEALLQYRVAERDRNLAASPHLRAFLSHGPQVVAEVLQATTRARLTEAGAGDLAEVWHLRSVLERAQRETTQWHQIEALMSAPPSGSAEAGRRASDERFAALWRYAQELPYSGAALIRVARETTPSSLREPNARARAAAPSADVAAALQPRPEPKDPVVPGGPPADHAQRSR
jgi:hypothetical protein